MTPTPSADPTPSVGPSVGPVAAPAPSAGPAPGGRAVLGGSRLGLVPRVLPHTLTITLWDFSWYVRTGPGEPFEDLDAAFAQAVERGYDTVRVCAMPFLLFGSGLPTDRLRFGGLGGGVGRGTRWYDVGAPGQVDGRAHLLALFEAARRHDCFVVLSSWEYQQSPAYADGPAWFEALMAVPPEDRPATLARCFADLLDLLAAHGLDDRVAFVELHNEVQVGRLTDGLPGVAPAVVELHDRLARGIDVLKARHPRHLVTVNYCEVPVGQLRGVPRNADVLVFHPYVYGVLGELVDTFALRDASRPFDQARARAELLHPDAPDLAAWTPPPGDAWRVGATLVQAREMYVHDWCDPQRWDAWLEARYPAWAHEMDTLLTTWLAAAADLAAERDVPLVLGEGWIGYTPLHGRFEEGAVGAAVCRRAAQLAAGAGAWGSVVCSNAAPHHPMWADVALQREVNALFRSGAPADPAATTGPATPAGPDPVAAARLLG